METYAAITVLYLGLTISVGLLICYASRITTRNWLGFWRTMLFFWSAASGGIGGLAIAAAVLEIAGIPTPFVMP